MSIGRNSLLNLVGLGLPLVVAVGAIPPLLAALGDARFGLLTLLWAVVSYLGFLDLGLGRALTREVAAADARGAADEVPGIVATATVVLVALGAAAGVVMAWAGPWGLSFIEAVPDRAEAERAVVALAWAMPAIIVTLGFRGLLEARGRFVILNVIRVPMGVATFLAPLAVVWLAGPRLDWIAWTLVGVRVAAALAHGWYAWRALAGPGRRAPTRRHLRPLATTGGWITLSNFISPLMGYVDRFMVGAMVSAAAVAWYATPAELVTKLWIAPGALTMTLFPALAGLASDGRARAWELVEQAVGWLVAGVLPVALALALFAHEILAWWIDPAFASRSAGVMRLFALGVLINCTSHTPMAMLQAFGAPRIVAVAHIVQLPLFVGALWIGISLGGVEGAAAAFALRFLLDTTAMFILGARACNVRPLSLITPPRVVLALAVLAAFLLGPALPWWARAALLATAFVPFALEARAWAVAGGALPARLARLWPGRARAPRLDA